MRVVNHHFQPQYIKLGKVQGLGRNNEECFILECALMEKVPKGHKMRQSLRKD